MEPILALLEATPGAREGALRAWSANASSAATARGWAGFFHETGRTELALPLWAALLRAGVLSADELNHIAASVAQGEGARPADAERIFRMLLREEPDYPQALLNLGGLAYGAGDRSACEAWWGRFLAVHPGRPEAATVRQKLAELRGR